MIDLHLHTTASDGRLTPDALVERVAAAGVTVMAVTDHDTTAATAEVQRAAQILAVEVVTGIEITAVERERDIHVLGYFIDPDAAALSTFLSAQRASRVARVEAIADRLATLGVVVDMRAELADARSRSWRSIGRPQVAQAMVRAGVVRDTRDAFDQWLASGRPGFVPREGAPVSDVIAIIHEAGGLASLAHPGKTDVDAWIPMFREAGLDAIEVFHTEHDATTQDRYARLAGALGLLMTGGSDFHGTTGHGGDPGSVSLPRVDWQRLRSARPRRG